MPRPFTGGAGVSPLPSLEGSGAAADSPSVSGSGWGAVGFAAGAAGAFLAPGRRAPGAMPRPLTSGSGLAGASAAASAGASDFGSAGAAAAVSAGVSTFVSAGAAAGFLAPGRLAPAAMPRPLTSGSGLAGACAVSAGASAGACAFASVGAADAVCAGSAGVVFFAPGRLAPAAMPSPLAGAARAPRRALQALLTMSAPAQTAEPSSRRAALHRPRCRVP